MSHPQIRYPETDPTPIFELFRGSYATELLTAAIAHFGLFGYVAEQARRWSELQTTLQLQDRPLHVLLTALQAMQLLACEHQRYKLTPLAREHLIPGGWFDVGDYIGLAAQSPGVLAMVECLRTNKPLNFDSQEGTAFIYRDGIRSAMELSASARHFTLALAGRAKNVAPVLAERLDLSQHKTLLDLGGGTGIYSLELLKRYPQLRAVVLDRPEVLKVAEECARSSDVTARLTLQAGDMFTDAGNISADVVLLSNILHDWDVPECQSLVAKCAELLPAGGKLCIHDVFLHDTLDGPLPLALYSAALFTLTEGRAYSALEYRQWMEAAGLQVAEPIPTLIHCGVLVGVKT
jgi:ubiquinone/menaquinone biosynthesis C-methylase UbiE